jgi:hypothetical protein
LAFGVGGAVLAGRDWLRGRRGGHEMLGLVVMEAGTGSVVW